MLFVAVTAGCDPAPIDPADTVDAGCDEEQEVTWDAFADGFFRSRCQACHASTSPDRRGAPDGVAFDDEAATRGQGERVRARVLVEPTMPPGGGLSESERALLDVWLSCAD